MARPEITGRKPRSAQAIESAHHELDTTETNKLQHSISEPPFQPVYTVEEFCKAHRISVSFFYKMKEHPEKYGKPPQEMRRGTRVLITYEAAARWRAEGEAKTAAEPAPKRASKKATVTATFRNNNV